MSIKTTLIYSPNFDNNRRKNTQIKFIIFHYTGMRKESEAIKRLTNIQSQVSTHYFIKKNGEIITMVPDAYIAWHAGKSYWKKYKSLNKNSIGIEISNPGHEFGYKNFSKPQIKNLIKLSKYLMHKYNVKKNCFLGHSDISPDRKLDPGEKFPWDILAKNKIGIWHNFKKKKLIKLRRKNTSANEKNSFMANLKKLGYSHKSLNRKNIRKNSKLLVRAFQRRYRGELINGKIDQESLLIIRKLIAKA